MDVSLIIIVAIIIIMITVKVPYWLGWREGLTVGRSLFLLGMIRYGDRHVSLAVI